MESLQPTTEYGTKPPPLPENPSHLHLIPKAIALIAVLGGIFFLLAANEMLPGIPNQISYLGAWGDALGAVMVAAGGIALLYLCRPRLIDIQETKPEIPQKLQEGLEQLKKETKNRDERTKIYQTHRPKCAYDQTPFDHVKWMDFYGRATRLVSDINWLDSRFGKPEKLATCLSEYKELYDKGRYTITPIQNMPNPPEMLESENEWATNLNDKIDKAGKGIANYLAKTYPTESTPPRELGKHAESGNAALHALYLQWRELVN